MHSKLCPSSLCFLKQSHCAGLFSLLPLILYLPVRAYIVLLGGFPDVWLAPNPPFSLCHHLLDFSPSQTSLWLLSLCFLEFTALSVRSNYAEITNHLMFLWFTHQKLFSDLFPFLLHVNSRSASVLFHIIFILGLRLKKQARTYNTF